MKGRILFFDTGGDAYQGVVTELASLGYEPVFNNAALAAGFRKRGLNAFHWQEFAPATLAGDTQQQLARMTQAVQQYAPTAEGQRSLTSSLATWLPRSGTDFFRAALEQAGRQIEAIELFHALVTHADVRGVILGCDNSPVQRAVVLAARRRGIPSIQLAHAIFGHSKAVARIAGEMHTLYSDHICVFGERAKRDLIETGTEADRIQITGAPHWERLADEQANLSREEAKRRLGLDPDRPVVLYCGGYAEGASAAYYSIAEWLDRTYRAVADACRQSGRDVQLVVRPHPHEFRRHGITEAQRTVIEDLFRSWSEELDQPVSMFSWGNKVEAITASDVVIAAASSSVIPEIMIRQRAVLGVSVFPQAGLLYDETDGVATVRHPHEIGAALTRLLGDAGYLEDMLGRQAAALADIRDLSHRPSVQRIALAADTIIADADERRNRIDLAIRGKSTFRILLAVHDFFPTGTGGTERYTRDLALALRSRGHDVEILHPRATLAADAEPRLERASVQGIPVTRLLLPKGSLSATRLDAIKPRIRALFAESRFDLVHAQHLMGLGPSFIEVVKEHGVPLVLTANDFWSVCEQVHLMHPDGQVCSGPETVDKCVQCIRRRLTIPETQIPHTFFQLADRHYTVRRSIASVDLLLCPSKFLRDTYERHGFVARRVEHLPQGAQLSPALPRRPRVEGAPIVFGFLGHVAYRKGLDLAVRAFCAVDAPNAELKIYGINSEPKYLEQILATVPAGKVVKYLGEYQQSDMAGILAGIDVAVIPSRGENFPFVIREILHHRVPVVASDVAGIPEIVTDGVNGRLFPSEDHSTLARILGELAEDPAAIDNLRNGITPIKSIDEDAGDMEQRYAELMADRGGVAGVNFVLVAVNDSSPTLVHAESAAILADGLCSAGTGAQVQRNRVQPQAVNIFIGFEQIETFEPLDSVWKIAWQVEPLKASERNTKSPIIQKLRQADEVWSHSSIDVSALDELGIQARLLPVGVAGPIVRQLAGSPKDLDVIFEGDAAPRQQAILNQLEQFCEVTRFQGAFGSDRENLFRRAKVVVVLAEEENSALPIAKILHLMKLGVLVVAEAADENPFGPALLCASKKELPGIVKEMLNSDEARARQIARADDWLRDRPLGDLLRNWLKPATADLQPTGRSRASSPGQPAWVGSEIPESCSSANIRA